MSNANAYARVTRVILDALRQGTIPWRRTWATDAPQSVRGHRYRGINALVTTLVAMEAGYDDPRWITYRHAKERGGHVRKGEKSTSVIYWTWIKRRGAGQGSAPSETHGEAGEGARETFAIAKIYRVFNVAQCDGLDLAPWDAQRPERSPIEACEALVRRYRGGAPRIVRASAPSYEPATDRVRMPPLRAFESAEAYHAALFHELVHSTGHATRLARKGVTDLDAFGSHQYAKEELIAELGAAFLCARAGIESATRDSAASYLAHWLGVLEADPSILVGAAQHAQHAVDWIADEQAAEASASEAA